MLFFTTDFRVIAAALILDFTFGDPQNLRHPVMAIGYFIDRFERKWSNISDTEAKGKAKGLLLWISTIAVTLLSVIGLMKIALTIHPLAYQAVNIALLWMGIAAKSLKKESMNVYHAVCSQNIDEARQRLSYIVGRDTRNLSFESVILATVETVAENTSDGVIAPLFYGLIGGAPLMWAYKAVNTLDSMVGYTSDKYRYFGYVSAKMDDLFNYIPARLTALFMVASSYLLGYSGKESYRTWRKDCRNHKSPNSGHPEAAAAGALGIQLGGSSIYSGRLVHKPYIGIRKREPQPEDIRRTNRMMQTAAVLFLGISGAIIRVYMKGGV